MVVDDVQAGRELPQSGVPPCLLATCQEVEGMDNAPVQLDGPASRAPEHNINDDAGEACEGDSSDSSTEAAGETPAASMPKKCTASLEDLEAGVAISSIALDPVHHLQPVQIMQALQGQIARMHEQVAAIAKNELQGKGGRFRRRSSICRRRSGR